VRCSAAFVTLLFLIASFQFRGVTLGMPVHYILTASLFLLALTAAVLYVAIVTAHL